MGNSYQATANYCSTIAENLLQYSVEMHSCLFYTLALLSLCGSNGNIANLIALQHNAQSYMTTHPFYFLLASDQARDGRTQY